VSVSLYGPGYLGDGDTDRRESLHDERAATQYDFLPLLVATHSVVMKCGFKKRARVDHLVLASQIPKFLPLDRVYLENDKSQRYITELINISSTRPF